MIANPSLLAEIGERPDDDEPRLRYADWLDEQGDPHAELIRVQCRLARLPEDAANRRELEQQEAGAYQAVVDSWPVPLQRAGFLADEIRFHRGMIEEVEVSRAQGVDEVIEVLLAFAPTIREMRLSKAAGFSGSLFGGGDFKAVCLELDRFLAHRALRHLRVFGILKCGVGADGAAVFGTSATVAGLEDLSIIQDEIGDAGAAHLAGSPHLSRVMRLTLLDNEIGADGAAALAGWTHPGMLRHLHLVKNRIGDAGIEAIANSESLSGLNELLLSANGITDAGARALAGSSTLNNLNWLAISDQQISPAGKDALVRRFGDNLECD